MSRPSGWDVLDLPRDPTPGDVWDINALARQVERVVDDADGAARDVRSIAGDGAVRSWLLPDRLDALVEGGYLVPVGNHPVPEGLISQIPATGRPAGSR